MKNLLLHFICHKLSRLDYTTQPYGLKHGAMGIVLFEALYSHIFSDEKARHLASSYLSHVLKVIETLPATLLDGKIGVCWGVRHLVNKNILEEGNLSRKYFEIGIRACLAFHSAAPLFLYEPHIFSGGIYMLTYSSVADTIEWHSHHERLIMMIDECERLLCHSIPEVYNPQEMSLSMFHSILHFLQRTDEMRIYPFQTQHLLQQMQRSGDCIIPKGSETDKYITRFLMSGMSPVPRLDGIESKIHFLGEIGFYSMLYDKPQLFRAAFNVLEEEQPECHSLGQNLLDEINPSVGTLCGLGYGLLTMKGEEHD